MDQPVPNPDPEEWQNFLGQIKQLRSSINLPRSIQDKLAEPNFQHQLLKYREILFKWSQSAQDLPSYISVVVEQICQGNELSEQDMALIAILPKLTNSFRLKMFVFLEKITFYLRIKPYSYPYFKTKMLTKAMLKNRNIIKKIKYKKSINPKILEKLLAEDNRFISSRDKEGNTPLHQAMQAILSYINYTIDNPHVSYMWNILNILIEKAKSDDLNLKNNNGQTPLHLAVKCDSLCSHHRNQIVLDLVKRGARIDIKDSAGNTPLHDAVRYENLHLVETLWKVEPAIWDIKNEQNETIIDKLLPPYYSNWPDEVAKLRQENLSEEEIIAHRYHNFFIFKQERELLIRLWIESGKLNQLVCLMKSPHIDPASIENKCQILKYLYQNDKSPPALLELYHATSEEVQKQFFLKYLYQNDKSPSALLELDLYHATSEEVQKQWVKTKKEKVCSEVSQWTTQNWQEYQKEYQKINALREQISSQTHPNEPLKALKRFLDVIILPPQEVPPKNYSLPVFDRHVKQPPNLKFLAFYNFVAKSPPHLQEKWRIKWMETASRAFNNEKNLHAADDDRPVNFDGLINSVVRSYALSSTRDPQV